MVRHAKAGSRHAWDSPDELRPLTEAGWAQAEALAEILAAEEVKRVVTSRYVRCVQTLEPLARRLGLPVEEHDALAEEADFDATWALLQELSGAEAAVCTHGNLVTATLDRLHRLGVERVAGDWSAKKGSVWRLEAGPDGRFARACLTPPPRR